MNTAQRYMTVDEAAALLGISPKTLRNWVDGKKVEFTRVRGWAIRFTPEQVQAMCETVTPKATTPRRERIKDTHGI